VIIWQRYQNVNHKARHFLLLFFEHILNMYSGYTGLFNISFHTFQDVLCGHKQVRNVNTHWSGNVSVLIYSPLKLTRVANFLDRAVHPWCSCLPYTGSQGQAHFLSDCCGVTQLCDESDSDITIVVVHFLTLETELLLSTTSNYYYSIVTPLLSCVPG
jgi:hypothetical protein